MEQPSSQLSTSYGTNATDRPRSINAADLFVPSTPTLPAEPAKHIGRPLMSTGRGLVQDIFHDTIVAKPKPAVGPLFACREICKYTSPCHNIPEETHNNQLYRLIECRVETLSSEKKSRVAGTINSRAILSQIYKPVSQHTGGNAQQPVVPADRMSC
ncbi:hypothetical protein J6590_018656 [Homalodisca vitripennis]|nr:hypothetical protein J6590_018656 [Homalodisca vitripennis]